MKYKMIFCFIFLGANSYSQFTDKMESTLQVVDIYSKKITIIYKSSQHIEAPNWSKDGNYFIANSNGKLYKIALDGSTMKVINTDFADSCNNDHGISPDGKQLVISHNRNVEGGKTSSAIYTLAATGGKPMLITELSPSYWHGWSPDGTTLAYCAERNGNYDVYTIPVNGGKETRLTAEEGLDDGPDYSPDGKYIYFNAFRNGSMQIWRMKNDGSNQEQLTNDSYSNWFAHPSRDSKWIVFISYIEDQGQTHPFGKKVKLRLMSLEDNTIHDITEVFLGGQGTMNVPSWAPDSKRLAFISYNVRK